MYICMCTSVSVQRLGFRQSPGWVAVIIRRDGATLLSGAVSPFNCVASTGCCCTVSCGNAPLVLIHGRRAATAPVLEPVTRMREGAVHPFEQAVKVATLRCAVRAGPDCGEYRRHSGSPIGGAPTTRFLGYLLFCRSADAILCASRTLQMLNCRSQQQLQGARTGRTHCSTYSCTAVSTSRGL